MRLIDADALHAKICEDSENNYGAAANIAQVLLRIETAPTIIAEPVRHGHWMFLEQKSGYLWTCSNCKGNFDQRFSYCPHCGADMEG